ncbi:hypothetical protein [Amycolatopsis sp. NPDC051071]|uniref:hypothetical protein n=1 Tax=Amycolatopsis sp. NPDC051071 TaxID=3154637 RepID=UPI0034282208
MEVGTALGVSGPDAAAGFAEWLGGQVRLYQDTGIGLSVAEADDLVRLADVVNNGDR